MQGLRRLDTGGEASRVEAAEDGQKVDAGDGNGKARGEDGAPHGERPHERQLQREHDQVSETFGRRIRALRDKVELALNDGNQLEL